MRIYLQPPQPSRGLQRIADALTRYLPEGWETVPHIGEADLVILYAIGRRDALQLLTSAIRDSKFQKYAIIQVCLKSTMAPNPWDWIEIWRDAEVVWSYYDLEAALSEGEYLRFATFKMNNFYHAPLGADAAVFYPRERMSVVPEDGYVILSSGLSRLSESVRECHLAAEEVGRKSAHLGALLSMKHPDYYCNLNDDVLARLYSGCEFVSALRRKEGFELPAVEGLLCGARPICFKGADWEWNYGHHAIYIEETDRQGVIDQLVPIFRHGAPSVTEEERQRAVERYDWAKIVGGFYDRLS